MWQIGDYKQSNAFAEEALTMSDKNIIKAKDSSYRIFLKEKANACNNLAIINRFLGDYSDAIKNHLAALKIREEIGDKKGVARSYLGIGSIYNFMGKNTEALDYKFKSKKIFEEINDSAGMAKVYNHIAYIFYDLNKYDSVDKYNNKSLMIYLKNLNIRGMADVYDLFGLTYLKKKEYNTAIENFNTCLQYRTMLFSQNEIAESNIFLGLAHKEIKDYGRSYKYYKTALSLAKLIGSKEHQKNAYKGLYELDSIKGDFTSAFANHKLYVTYRDSLVGLKTSETITQLQGQFENEKKEQIRAMEEKQTEMKRMAEEKEQKVILYAVCGGLILMVVLAIVIYRGSKQKQKANIELLAKNEIIEQQKNTVEDKQKEIIDSIRYAKRIQNSLLPTEKYIDKSFKRLKDK
ncbi:MAG: tetratricopeptide repeat protein [Bacteroidetes bacterium]|nr:tetratricopeptide repeat protein [Bacteroidota bacterium]